MQFGKVAPLLKHIAAECDFEIDVQDARVFAPRRPEPDSCLRTLRNFRGDCLRPDHWQSMTVAIVQIVVVNRHSDFMTPVSRSDWIRQNVAIPSGNPGHDPAMVLMDAVIHRRYFHKCFRTPAEVDGFRQWLTGEMGSFGPDLDGNRDSGNTARRQPVPHWLTLNHPVGNRFNGNGRQRTGVVVVFNNDHLLTSAVLGNCVQVASPKGGEHPAAPLLPLVVNCRDADYALRLSIETKCGRKLLIRKKVAPGAHRQIDMAVGRQGGSDPELGRFALGHSLGNRNNRNNVNVVAHQCHGLFSGAVGTDRISVPFLQRRVQPTTPLRKRVIDRGNFHHNPARSREFRFAGQFLIGKIVAGRSHVQVDRSLHRSIGP